MAMTKCKECKADVSTDAKTCPHCGVRNPGLKPGQALAGLALVIGIAVVVVKCTGDDTPSTTAAEPGACLADLQCWGDKHLAAAGIYCKDHIAGLAKFSAKWTDGTFEPKFSRFRWLDQGQGTLTYIGDRIEFQNGFGAFQPHVYECDFRPGQTVLEVRAQPGRL